MPAVVKWTFFDPVTSETYTFDINPNTGGSPPYKKKMAYENTTAPDGKTLMFEGQDEVQQLEWSGVILSEDQHNKYIEWWQKRRQIQVTDDLGRQYWVYLTSYAPKRERARSYPWKHQIEVSATIVNW